MKTTTIGFLAALGVVSAGCGSAREAQQAALSAPTANVVGTWTGSTTTGGSFVPVTLTLGQTGTDVTGTMVVAGRPDLTGPVTGSVRGELVQLSLTSGATNFGQLRAQQDTMTGNAFGLQFMLHRMR